MNKLLLGILAGIGIGVLLAPDKGSETVKKLRKRFSEYTDDAADKAEDWLDETKKAYTRANDKFGDMTE